MNIKIHFEYSSYIEVLTKYNKFYCNIYLFSLHLCINIIVDKNIIFVSCGNYISNTSNLIDFIYYNFT
jgi:hypothetical protein